MLSRKLTSEDDSAIRDELDALVKAEVSDVCDMFASACQGWLTQFIPL